LKRLAGSLAELNSGRNAGSLGMKNKELISMMHSTGTAISNGDRVAVGICVSEMDRLVRESRVLFKQILEGADITQDMSQVAYRNLYNRMEYCIRQSCNTYQQHASVQTLLGQVAALADEYKAAGWLTDEVARAMKNWANAVKAQGIVKYAQVCGQELQKVVNFNMEELLNWKQMQGIEDSLTPKPWTDRLRFDITESDGIYGEELTEITKLTRNVPKNLWVYSGSVQYAERNVFFEYDLPGLQKLGQALQRDIKKIIGVEGDCIFLGNAQSRLSYLQTQTLTTDNWKEIGIEAQELAMRLMWRYENGAVEAQNSIRQMFGISDKKLTDELIEECMVKFKEWKKIGAASLTRVQEKQLRRILEVMQETEDTIEQAREVALQLRAIQVNAAMYRLDGLVSEAKAAAEMAGEQLKKLNLLDSSRMEALSGFMAGGVLAERITAQLWCKDVELTLNETQAGVLDINSLIGMGTEAMKLFRARELAGIDTNFIIPLGWRFISIDGCVTDTEGNPIDGAIVQATNLNLQQDSIEVETVNGAFMIPVEHHFWWGKGIVLSASAEGYKDHSISFQFQSYKRREIVLEKEENEQTVQGGVWNLYGAPVPGAEIIFQNSNTGDVHIITANNNGQYETKLPAGHWRMLTRGGYDLPYYHQQMQVNEDSTWDVDMRNSLIQTELLIRPRYSANGVRANAADVSFKPGDAVQISLWIPGSIKPLTLGVGATEIPIYDNKGNIIGYGQATVTILDDGRLSVSLNDIRSGKYRMQVTHPAYGTGDITYSNLTGKNRENYLYMSSKNPKPSPSPTIKPTVAPSPTLNPTVKPTATPTLEPSPLIKPTATPLLTPSPSVKPMVTPGLTPSPTVKPTVTPAPGSMPSPSVILSETA